MRSSNGLRWLPMGVVLCACSSTPPPAVEPIDVDPGRPAAEYGPKCAVDLVDPTTHARWIHDDCMVSAASSDRTSHAFFAFGRLPAGVQRTYISLVLGTTPLAAGEQSSARAGAIEATLEDGRKFAVPDLEKEGSFQLSIVKTDVVNGAYYLTGTLEATLQDIQDASSSLRLVSWINQPRTP